jgi:hypothetical protein
MVFLVPLPRTENPGNDAKKYQHSIAISFRAWLWNRLRPYYLRTPPWHVAMMWIRWTRQATRGCTTTYCTHCTHTWTTGTHPTGPALTRVNHDVLLARIRTHRVQVATRGSHIDMLHPLSSHVPYGSQRYMLLTGSMIRCDHHRYEELMAHRFCDVMRCCYMARVLLSS